MVTFDQLMLPLLKALESLWSTWLLIDKDIRNGRY